MTQVSGEGGEPARAAIRVEPGARAGAQAAAWAGSAPARRDAAPARVVLAAQGLRRGHGGKGVLAGLDLTLAAGETVAVLGRRNSGKSMLARVLAGLAPPDSGRLWRSAPPAPMVGSPAGFGATASTERDLGLRAAAYGISTRDHIAQVAALLDDPAVLARPFNRLDALSRVLLTFGATYLTPADLYVADGALLPQVPGARARLAPLLAAVRGRAAVVWIVSSAAQLRVFEPTRLLMLEDGLLHPLAGIEAAERRFPPGRAAGTD